MKRDERVCIKEELIDERNGKNNQKRRFYKTEIP